MDAYLGGVAGGQIMRVASAISTALLAPIVVAVLMIALTPTFVESFAHLNPSCDNPVGLSPIRLQPMLRNRELSIKASSVAEPPGPPSKAIWEASNVIDGNSGTPWVPAENDKKRRLTLAFKDKQDAQLICVVNGVASTSWAYLRAERIRAAYVHTGDNSVVRAPLRTLGEYDLQNRQPLKFAKGQTSTVTIEIAETYEGRTVFDPDVDRYLPRAKLVALGEIELYTKDPKAHKRFILF